MHYIRPDVIADSYIPNHDDSLSSKVLWSMVSKVADKSMSCWLARLLTVAAVGSAFDSARRMSF